MIQSDYRTTIDLNENEDYQLVLASMKSGTFFCVYAKFEKNEENPDQYNISFDVRNYRGNFNVGIDSINIIRMTPNSVHAKIYTNYSVMSKPFVCKNVTLSKGNYFICERENNQMSTLNFATPENSYINLTPEQQGDNKTQYEIEKEEIKKMFDQLRNSEKEGIKFAAFAASLSFCTLGISKIV